MGSKFDSSFSSKTQDVNNKASESSNRHGEYIYKNTNIIERAKKGLCRHIITLSVD